MSQKIERRYVTALLRMADDDPNDDGEITGYGAVYYDGTAETESEDLGGFKERLRANCFSRAMARSDFDCKCLVNHDANLILGRIGNGSLHISSDKKGLLFRCRLGKQTYAQDLRHSIADGLITQCSFGFLPGQQDGDEEWGFDTDEQGNRYRTRTHNHVDQLLDISAVTYPAYKKTSVSARELWPNGQPEAVLRALGQPAKEAELAFARAQRRNLINRVIGF